MGGFATTWLIGTFEASIRFWNISLVVGRLLVFGQPSLGPGMGCFVQAADFVVFEKFRHNLRPAVAVAGDVQVFDFVPILQRPVVRIVLVLLEVGVAPELAQAE